MFYEVDVRSFIRVPPTAFEKKTNEAVLTTLVEDYQNYVSKEMGFVIGVISVQSIGDGIIIAGDGAAYYDTVFKLLVYRPELHELVLGKINEITEFGAFINIGAVDGMVHISQTMDDFVSFSKTGVLTGKESKRVLKAKDKVRTRIVAVSFKDIENPKIGLTMRQPKLGAYHWIEDDNKKEQKKVKVEIKTRKK